MYSKDKIIVWKLSTIYGHNMCVDNQYYIFSEHLLKGLYIKNTEVRYFLQFMLLWNIVRMPEMSKFIKIYINSTYKYLWKINQSNWKQYMSYYLLASQNFMSLFSLNAYILIGSFKKKMPYMLYLWQIWPLTSVSKLLSTIIWYQYCDIVHYKLLNTNNILGKVIKKSFKIP